MFFLSSDQHSELKPIAIGLAVYNKNMKKVLDYFFIFKAILQVLFQLMPSVQDVNRTELLQYKAK